MTSVVQCCTQLRLFDNQFLTGGAVHRDLAAYAEALSKESGQPTEPAKLIAPMLARFMATDRAFVRGRK
jgi:hypothetical protein